MWNTFAVFSRLPRIQLSLSFIYTHFTTLKKTNFRKRLCKKLKLLIMSNFTFLYAHRRRDVLCYHPWQAGGVPHSLSGAYLQDYASYRYETSWVDRSHQGGVQCTGTITLACLILELLPFVYFHTWILSGAYLQNYTHYGYEILWVDRSLQGGVQCTWMVTLVCFFYARLRLDVLWDHPWRAASSSLSGAYLQNYSS